MEYNHSTAKFELTIFYKRNLGNENLELWMHMSDRVNTETFFNRNILNTPVGTNCTTAVTFSLEMHFK